MKRILLLVLLVANSFASDKSDKDVPIQTIEKMKHSLVPIVCGYIDDKKTFQLVAVAGSGFFVDQFGRFITAGHVLTSWQEISKTRRSCDPAIYVPPEGWPKQYRKSFQITPFTFVNCNIDRDLDLVLCQPIENSFTSPRAAKADIKPVTFNTQELPDGTPIAFTGFPLENTEPITSKGNISGLNSADNSDTEFDYIIDKAAWPGASGSPVYLPDGRVVGMIVKGGINFGSGLAYARSASAITRFLAKYPYVPPKAK